MQFRPLFALPLCVLLAVACGDTSNSEEDGEDGSNDPPKPTYIGAASVRVTQVAFYQGVKRLQMLDGFPGQSTIPLVAGRDLFVRVFYATDATYDGREVFGQMTLEGIEPLVVKQALYPSSNDADLASTINFWVPGENVGAQLVYSVGLVEEGKKENDNPAARWPASGAETVVVEGPQNTLRIRLAPFKYNADGSGRVPDVSPEQVERFRQRFRALYPVSNVEVTVKDPYPWSQGIYPSGQGWEEVGYTLFGFRGQENAPDDLYYYGIFNPTDSLYSFCGGGCLLGVTLLNNDPPATGSVQLRLALGVGYNEVALDTAAHEIGHAHGREHADCGPGLDPQSIDKSYPYPNGSIGAWGYDITTGVLVDPALYSDIMGYCDTQYISDYNYVNLFNRGKNVNAALMHPPTEVVEYDLIGIDGGVASWRGATRKGRPYSGKATDVSVRDADGHWRAVTGRYVRYDHLPGGWLLVPKATDGTGAEATRAEFSVDGAFVVAERQTAP